jgi:hypothetical protein
MVAVDDQEEGEDGGEIGFDEKMEVFDMRKVQMKEEGNNP